MERRSIQNLWIGLLSIALFIGWTLLTQTVDVHPVGETGTMVGLATINAWFHSRTGVNMQLYIITDWLGFVPIGICLLFGWIGFGQLRKRKHLLKVDRDLLFLGIYYVLVILAYLIFEIFPIHYRPIYIENRLEASYPSSTTLLVLSVMPTLAFQCNHRMQNPVIKKIIYLLTVFFSLFMAIGRLLSGVHWLVDIIGSVFLSAGFFSLYKAAVLFYNEK